MDELVGPDSPLTVSPDSRRLAGLATSRWVAWDLASGRRAAEWQTERGSSYLGHGWRGDALQLGLRAGKGERIAVRELGRAQPVFQLAGPLAHDYEPNPRPDVGLWPLFVRPNGKQPKGELTVCDLASGQRLWSRPQERGPAWMALNPRGDLLAVAGPGREIRTEVPSGATTGWTRGHGLSIYEARTGRPVVHRPGGLWNQAFTADGRLLLLTGERFDGPHTVHLFDPATAADVWSEAFPDMIAAWETDAAGRLVVLVRRKGARKANGPPVYETRDLASGRLLAGFRDEGANERSLALSPDGRRLAVGRSDGAISLWDPLAGTEILTLRGHVGTVVRVLFTPDSRRLISHGEDQRVRIWDATPLTGDSDEPTPR